MATHTTYYNLTKPAQNDKVNIGVLNDNADIIDTTLHNKVNTDELTADNVMMSDGVTSVEDVLNDLKPASDVEYTPNTTNLNNISIRRSGNVVVMYLQTKSINANTPAELLTIAEGYRPNNNIITMANNGDVTKFGQIMLEASTGKLTAYGANQTAYYGSLTYIIG